MAYPDLVSYESEDEYREHFERVYCQRSILSSDGISIRFKKEQFEHCFFESSKRDKVKDCFSTLRAERIDWILTAIQDPHADLYDGWDNKRKKYDTNRRVSVVVGDYVVIIRLLKDLQKAVFVTAFVADSPRTIARIKSGPKWSKSSA